MAGNRLSKLPSEVGRLQALKRLGLKGNALVQLPSSIGDLSHLVELYLTGNKLEELPDEVGRSGGKIRGRRGGSTDKQFTSRSAHVHHGVQSFSLEKLFRTGFRTLSVLTLVSMPSCSIMERAGGKLDCHGPTLVCLMAACCSRYLIYVRTTNI